MMKKILRNVFLALVAVILPVSICSAKEVQKPQDNTSNTAEYITFLSPEKPDAILLSNGISISFLAPSLGLGADCNPKTTPYYSQRFSFLGMGSSSTIECEGAHLEIKNTTNEIRVIKWAGSSIVIGGYSGIPFLDGMKYANAGNPSATPDTIIPPGMTIAKSVFLPSVSFHNDWSINGTPVPKNNTLDINLYLKIADANGAEQYFSLKSPTIGLPQ